MNNKMQIFLSWRCEKVYHKQRVRVSFINAAMEHLEISSIIDTGISKSKNYFVKICMKLFIYSFSDSNHYSFGFW